MKQARKTIFRNFTNTHKIIGEYQINPDYICTSWMLNEDLCEMMNKNSNIASFQKMFKFEQKEVDMEPYLFWVFKKERNFSDFEKLEATTSLQKGVKEKLIKHEPLFVVTGVFKG